MAKTAITPLANLVLVQEDKASTKTKSGIILPESASEKPITAVVQAVGPAVKDIKAGDHVIYKNYSTTEVKHDGKDYMLVRDEDVLAKVN